MTDPERFVAAARSHADTVLSDGRDPGGTALFVDAVDPVAGEAVAYDGRDVAADRRLANFALQQAFLRTLDALSTLTGEGAYREAASAATESAFEHLADGDGLLRWGGHEAFDVDAREFVGKGRAPHELKWEYPYYDLLFEVDPDATRRFVRAFWDAHVRDWSRLDFNRHGDDPDPESAVWNREYEGGDVFFWGDGLTFVNTGSDLYWAAGVLADHEGSEAPLTWAERLAERYVETRQDLGISGYQFSQHASWCNGPAIRGDRAQYQFAPYLHGDHLVYEGTLFRPRPQVQRRQLRLGERLGDRGEQFTEWAVEELRAWERVYRPETNEFEPVLTDGHSLEGFVVRREGYFGPQGRVVGPIEADAGFLWAYAMAHRVTGDEACERMAERVAAGLGDDADYRAVYGHLERYRATGEAAHREAAVAAADRVLDERFAHGAFVDDEGRAVLDDGAPLAMLHLAAALGDGDDLPAPGSDRATPAGGV